jgi:5-(aminomethyl)-3-furanmethanol phosphate kinase
MSVSVVKVGGSLAANQKKLRALLAALAEAAKKQKIVVVPGGGEFADVAREVDKRFTLSPYAAHRMAILGMDQYGLALADLTAGAVTVYGLKEAFEVLDEGRLPIFLPSRLMFEEDPLENSWNVTSDSIAAYIAGKLKASKLVLATCVDGIFTCTPEKNPDAQLIRDISAKQLISMKKRTSVDAFLPVILSELKVPCYVVNGLFLERVTAILNGKEAVCTRIEA